MTAEQRRLADSEARRADWKNWGPYVADRAWGTVREDYSADGEAWNHFPFEQARSRVFRWNEDGIAGFCNRFQNVCLTLALWNERDPFLKERFFGLSGPEGNHGEDAKEYWFHEDMTPTHSYGRLLYRYPQVEFPYERLVEENANRGYHDREFELKDALADEFREGRYFDVSVEYAKADEEDVLCRITAVNRGPDEAPLHLLPHVVFRNVWSWRPAADRPSLWAEDDDTIALQHKHLGRRWWTCRGFAADGSTLEPQLLFTENETNNEALFGSENEAPYVKDGIDNAVVGWRNEHVNPDRRGTKAAGWFRGVVPPGGSMVVEVRFGPTRLPQPFADFDEVVSRRRAEADEYFAVIQPDDLSDDERLIHRRAIAGLMWTKQFYHYSVDLWLRGDPLPPKPPKDRGRVRNGDWRHVYNLDVISMPDKWEYPWFAAWDLAFHCVTIALVDPEWAKRQMVLILREWYMHPNGQLPAYEWDFGDVNPPVHAWAAWRVFEITRDVTGEADHAFLEEVFHKLLLNFTWWVNRKDSDGQNVFEGGFLGLDNIGVFDRSESLHGGRLEQADGTGWMAMYCLNMLVIALELSSRNRAYEPIATKFFEHFVYIAHAMNKPGDYGLWDEADGFYYDRIHCDHGPGETMRVRSFVGLIPLFAAATIEQRHLDENPHFARRAGWFLKYRRDLIRHVHPLDERGDSGRFLLSVVDRDKLERILPRLFDESQFLADHGLRSLSRQHGRNPFELHLNGETFRVGYDPGESTSGLFGGNSNWRGPIWFPLNFLMIESLREYDRYFGDTLRPEFPRFTGRPMRLAEAADEIGDRLIGLFRRSEEGGRPVVGDEELFRTDPLWQDQIPFYEYFHGETGEGLGAAHQTGWTALVANLLVDCARKGRKC